MEIELKILTDHVIVVILSSNSCKSSIMLINNFPKFSKLSQRNISANTSFKSFLLNKDIFKQGIQKQQTNLEGRGEMGKQKKN